MYREVIHNKKVPAIVVSLLSITIALYAFKLVQTVVEKKLIIENIAAVVLILTISIILVNEYKKCKIAYKYSVIADKLIINKLNGKSADNLESIKIKDIVYIGEKINISKEYSKLRCHNNYTSRFCTNKQCCCIYRNGDELVKFIFNPSEKLINRIRNRSIKINKTEVV